jgi:hypothetical protein
VLSECIDITMRGATGFGELDITYVADRPCDSHREPNN